MVVGGYELHLYCDGSACSVDVITGQKLQPRQGEFVGPNERDCLKQARKRGWTFSRDKMKCFCKECKQ